MQKLIDGIHFFQKNVFACNRELFQRLARDGQTPAVLFITCADSRVNPNLITQTEPGDLVIMRNAGNIIPAHGSPVGGEAATIELAVDVLKVSDIVVCGHSHCSAMQAMIDPGTTADLPAVRTWLQHADATRRIMRDRYGHLRGDDLLTATAQENVLVQLEHLYTHPVVAAAMAADRIRVHGWMYKFETGEVFAYEARTGQFATLEGADRATPASNRMRPAEAR